MKVAVYARVSKADGSQTVENQLGPLRAYLGSRGDDVAAEFVEHASGADENRSELGALLERLDEFDAIAIVKLDRLARSVHHLTSLARELESRGVDLIVKDQGIDTSTPAGKLMFHVLGAVAEFERDLIVERTKAGLARARREGKQVGRPRLQIDLDQARAVLLREGSYAKAARELGVPATTLRRHLREEGASA